MSEDPDSGWMTKKEVIYSFLGALFMGGLSLLVAIFMDLGPAPIFATALCFFFAGVGSAPLFYKFWFKAED